MKGKKKITSIKKRRWLILLILFVSFLVFNDNVYAEDKCVTLSIGNNLSSTNRDRISQLYLGGTTALCNTRELLTYNGTIYKYAGQICGGKYGQVKKYLSTSSSGYRYAIAQAYLWGDTSDNLLFRFLTDILGLNISTAQLRLKEIGNDFKKIASMSTSGCLYKFVALSNSSNRQVLVALSMPSTTSCGTTETKTCYEENGKYYGADGKEVDEETYKAECGSTPVEPPTPTCETDPEIELADVCGITSTYNDIEDWSCITLKEEQFHETEYLSSKQESYNYCTFFCREDDETAFPGEGYTFQAGRYFTVGSSTGAFNTWGPIQVTGTRTCRSYYQSGSSYVSGINWSKFESDMKSANTDIKNKYTAWKREEALAEAISDSRNSSYSNNCDTSNDWHWVGSIKYVCSSGTADSDGRCPDGTWSKGTCESGQIRNGGCYRYEVEMDTYYPRKSATYITADDARLSVSAGGSCNSIESSNVAGKKSAYTSAVNERDYKITTMEQCSKADINYNFKPTLSLTYNNESYSIGTDVPLDAKLGYESSSVTENSGATTGTFSKVVCPQTGACTYQSDSVASAKNVTLKENVTTKSYYYNLSTKEYKYVSKVDGQVIKNPSNLDYYIDLGDYVIPLSYTLSPGRYEIGLKYSNIGHNGYFDEYVTEVGESPTPYYCYFDLKNDIMCNDCNEGDKVEGLDVIYRPIQLGSQAVAFPSIDGDGRTPGANWVGTTASGQSYVDAYITNNRGVSDYEVYNLEPLYTIEMTSAVIKKIREYNKNVGDYNDFNLTCTNGKQCYSSFIHSEFDEYIGGSCGDSGSGEFNSCVTSGGGS